MLDRPAGVQTVPRFMRAEEMVRWTSMILPHKSGYNPSACPLIQALYPVSRACPTASILCGKDEACWSSIETKLTHLYIVPPMITFVYGTRQWNPISLFDLIRNLALRNRPLLPKSLPPSRLASWRVIMAARFRTFPLIPLVNT